MTVGPAAEARSSDADQKTEMLCPPEVRRGLERALELGEVGLQVAAYLDGELVVDAWCGVADERTSAGVQADSLFPIFSTTKAFPVAAVNLLVERGYVDVEAPVARYWPAYGANGKDRVRVRDIFTHRSGVPQVPPGSGPDEMADWDRMIEGIAALAPLSPPGEKSSYQALNLGWVLGEVVRGADPEHRHFSRFVREEILDPLGCDNTWLGLPIEEEPRLVAIAGQYTTPTPDHAAPGRQGAYGGYTSPQRYASRSVRAACLPATNAITTARSCARFWAMLAGRGRLGSARLFSEHRVWSWLRPRPNPLEYDDVLGLAPMIGIGGFWLGDDAVGAHPDLLCQPGAGGSIGWAELESRLAVVICHNRMFTYAEAADLPEHPHHELIRAIRRLARG
jgi:CubicO group peptidase (beta-lactamase class C family)